MLKWAGIILACALGVSLPASAQEAPPETTLYLPRTVSVEDAEMMVAWTSKVRDCLRSQVTCDEADRDTAALKAKGWCYTQIQGPSLGFRWEECGEPCANWRGWDPNAQRDICGPATIPANAADVTRFKARWRRSSEYAGNAAYAANCGALAWIAAHAINAEVETRMGQAPEWPRFSAKQGDDILLWHRSIVRERGLAKCPPVPKWPL